VQEFLNRSKHRRCISSEELKRAGIKMLKDEE